MQYDAILLSINLSIMGGLEVTRKIRASGFTLPIIAVTVYAANEYKQQYLHAGMNYSLALPVNSEFFYETLAKWTKK